MSAESDSRSSVNASCLLLRTNQDQNQVLGSPLPAKGIVCLWYRLASRSSLSWSRW